MAGCLLGLQVLFGLSILLLSADKVSAQFTCYSAVGCSAGNELTEFTTAEACCLSMNGLSFNDGTCRDCVVYGWDTDSSSREEFQTPYDVIVGYIKGHNSSSPTLAFMVNDIESGRTGSQNSDYIVSTTLLTINNGNRMDTTTISFETDNFALEPDEFFLLELTVLSPTGEDATSIDTSLPNVFFRSRQNFTIVDTTGVTFRIREMDISRDEDAGVIPVVVEILNQRILATPVSFLLTPQLSTLADRVPASISPPDRRDFNDTVITITFEAGGEIVLTGDVPINDDEIDEANEVFITRLSLADPSSDPGSIVIGNDRIVCEIVDNDDIFIGFQIPNGTYPEIEMSYSVSLIKGAGNITEQNLQVVVNIVQNVPTGSNFQVATLNEASNNDLEVPPGGVQSIITDFLRDSDEITVDFDILPDELPETTEAIQFTIAIPNDATAPVFRTLPEYPTFFVIIEDNDRFRIGFENITYTVDEGIGSIMVCVRMFEPSPETMIGLTINLAVETFTGTADENDYSPLSGFGGLVSFNNLNRRRCINIRITEDEFYEFEESFQLRLGGLPNIDLPSNLVVDPAVANVTIVDNEDVVVGFIGSPYITTEGEGATAVFRIGVISGATNLSREISFMFSTSDGIGPGGIAVAGGDYISIFNMIITLGPGQLFVDIPVDIVNDEIFEMLESFYGNLVLTEAFDRVTVDPAMARADIMDDGTQCPELEPIANGSITYDPDMTPDFDIGTIAIHQCDPGFSLVGAMFRNCTVGIDGTGEWNEDPPTCEPQCPELQPIVNGFITYAPDDVADFDIGTVATYQCNPGSILVGVMTRECVEAANGTGVFNGVAPVCEPKCPELLPIVNGFITYGPDDVADFDIGTVATYECNPGFFLIGVMTRDCVEAADGTGVFNGVAPVCEPRCPELEPIENGFITYDPDMIPDFDIGTIAIHQCNPGFILVGVMFRNCTAGIDGTGEWSEQPPTCELIQISNTVNDTVTGDPLFTVPLNVPDKTAIMNLGEDDPINLCFEVHGADDAYFNLVSDACVSVNAHYIRVRPEDNINIIDSIHVRAVDSNGTCRNIDVSLNQCGAMVDGVSVDMYNSAGISVRRFRNRVRIVVPNCQDIDLVMWVFCLNNTFWSREDENGTEITFRAEMIRFVIARGLDLAERSHGILGQFWNIPIQVEAYTGLLRDGTSGGGYYIITVSHPEEEVRRFVGWLYPLTWEFREEYCLYAGQQQAGEISEIADETVNGPVINGTYSDYRVAGAFETGFKFSHFVESNCN